MTFINSLAREEPPNIGFIDQYVVTINFSDVAIIKCDGVFFLSYRCNESDEDQELVIYCFT